VERCLACEADAVGTAERRLPEAAQPHPVIEIARNRIPNGAEPVAPRMKKALGDEPLLPRVLALVPTAIRYRLKPTKGTM
jgi:hypothetical protein